MKRRFDVQITVGVTLEVDDEATPDIGRDRSLMDLAVQIGIDNRRLSNVDGWADFPDAACIAVGFPEYELDHVREATR